MSSETRNTNRLHIKSSKAYNQLAPYKEYMYAAHLACYAHSMRGEYLYYSMLFTLFTVTPAAAASRMVYEWFYCKVWL